MCICIPTFNAERTIINALKSICSQSYTNLIVKVIDNASSDRTVKLVSEYDDSRITIFQNQDNVGAEGNFTRCISLASGDYTAIYHADDIYESNIVYEQVNYLELHQEAGAVFTEAATINDDGRRIGSITTPSTLINNDKGLYNFDEIFKAIIKNSNFLICPSAMVRTRIYKDHIKKWRGELFGTGADLDVWLRIAQKYPIGIIRRKLINYRIGMSQGSASVRLDTEPGKIFKIIDYYLSESKNHHLINDELKINYNRLKLRDQVGRSINYFIVGDYNNAVIICKNIWTKDGIRSALETRSGLVTLIFGTFIRLMCFFRIHRVGVWTLIKIKKYFNK